MYKTEIIRCTKNIKKRALAIEIKANEMEKSGWLLASTCATPNFGVILTFFKQEK